MGVFPYPRSLGRRADAQPGLNPRGPLFRLAQAATGNQGSSFRPLTDRQICFSPGNLVDF